MGAFVEMSDLGQVMVPSARIFDLFALADPTRSPPPPTPGSVPPDAQGVCPPGRVKRTPPQWQDSVAVIPDECVVPKADDGQPCNYFNPFKNVGSGQGLGRPGVKVGGVCSVKPDDVPLKCPLGQQVWWSGRKQVCCPPTGCAVLCGPIPDDAPCVIGRGLTCDLTTKRWKCSDGSWTAGAASPPLDCRSPLWQGPPCTSATAPASSSSATTLLLGGVAAAGFLGLVFLATR
jgi:hypothetical protein